MAHNVTQQAFFTLKMLCGFKVRPYKERLSISFYKPKLTNSNSVHISCTERAVQTTEAAAIHDRNAGVAADVPSFTEPTTLRQHYLEIFRFLERAS